MPKLNKVKAILHGFNDSEKSSIEIDGVKIVMPESVTITKEGQKYPQITLTFRAELVEVASEGKVKK